MNFGKGKNDNDSNSVPASIGVVSGSSLGGTSGFSTQPFSQTSSAQTSSTSSSGRSEPGRSEVYLGKGTKVVGSLSFAGVAEIDCVIEGEIFAQEKVVVGESGTVKGKITGAEVVVRGEVIGDIVATRRLSLRKPAKVVGNISAPLLSVEEGVTFEGKCVMNASQASGGLGAPAGAGTSTKGSVVSISEKAA